MKRVVALVVVALAVLTASMANATPRIAQASAASAITTPAAVRFLSYQASTALGDSHFACLASVYRYPDGRRSLVGNERSTRIGLSLLVTARVALPGARRFERAHKQILSTALIAPRYSRGAMRHLAKVVSAAMAPYPRASVSMGGPRFRDDPPCPSVDIGIAGPVFFASGPAHVEARPTFEETKAAALALAHRYGRIRVVTHE